MHAHIFHFWLGYDRTPLVCFDMNVLEGPLGHGLLKSEVFILELTIHHDCKDIWVACQQALTLASTNATFVERGAKSEVPDLSPSMQYGPVDKKLLFQDTSIYF